MPKKKKGVAARAGRGNTRLTGSGRYNAFPGQDHSSSGAHVLHSFSLLEAARNTERRHVWSSDLKLRHAQIAFVSANRPHSDVIGDVNGNLSHEPLPGNAATRDTQGFSPEIRIADLSINTHIEHGVGTVPRIGMDIPVVSTDLVSQGGTAKELAHSCNEQHKVFASDTQRYTKDSRMESKLPPTMIPQSSSSDASDSSEEVIIFRGRDRSQRRLNRKSTSYASDLHQRSTSATRKPAPQYQPILPVISDVPIANAPNPDTSVSRKARLGNYASSDVFTDSNSIYKDKPLTNTSWNRATRPHESQEEQYEDEALEDYMKNIQENENIDQFLTEGQVSEGGLLISDTNIWGKMAAMNSETMMSENPPKTKAGVNWSEVNLHVIEELETCDKIPGIIDRVLLRRNRPSGVQYLVVSEGYTLDDARWVPFSSLDTPDAKEQLRVFEINSRTHSQPFIIGDDTDGLSSDLDKQAAIDLENEFDDMLDEEELLERKRRRMTDEQIARLLSKQEEFDLGSNELLLFGADGETEKSESESDCIHIIRARPTIFGSSMNKKEKNRQDRFAPASSFANSLDRDPYDGFDIMDRERPSINRKSKSNRGAARFGLSDSEMEVEMHLSWGKDREKKRMHKQERADLRNQGLLARKGKLDIKAKYRAGMSMEDVKKEIKDFLVSSTQSVLSLIPMDKRQRIMVHEIANAFNLKSKSIGGGRSRYPVLYKTSRTVMFDQDAVGEIEARLAQKWSLPHVNRRTQHGAKVTKETGKRQGRGASGAAVSYRDGEIVGAAAPELGIENRGRAMLEKMGWSTGTALGAVNNKGIMQPVIHVVKTTKAGLG